MRFREPIFLCLFLIFSERVMRVDMDVSFCLLRLNMHEKGAIACEWFVVYCRNDTNIPCFFT